MLWKKVEQFFGKNLRWKKSGAENWKKKKKYLGAHGASWVFSTDNVFYGENYMGLCFPRVDWPGSVSKLPPRPGSVSQVFRVTFFKFSDQKQHGSRRIGREFFFVTIFGFRNFQNRNFGQKIFSRKFFSSRNFFIKISGSGNFFCNNFCLQELFLKII